LNNKPIRHDACFRWGDRSDLVVGLPVLTGDGHVVEASYFAGTIRPKGIVVISSQAGCPLSCQFCELGMSQPFGRDLTVGEMVDQFWLLRNELRQQGIDIATSPHKLTVANGGEPLLNPNLTEALSELPFWLNSFKVSTVMPKAAKAFRNLEQLARFAGQLDRPVQLQVSLLSANQAERNTLSCGRTNGSPLADFAGIRRAGELWREHNPNGRKVNLSLMVTDCLDAKQARKAVGDFPPELFRFRLREYVPTVNGCRFLLASPPAGRFRQLMEEFRSLGYEVSDAGRPSPVERRFNLVANAIRRMYLEMLEPPRERLR